MNFYFTGGLCERKKNGSLSLSSFTSLCSFQRGIDVGRTVNRESNNFFVWSSPSSLLHGTLNYTNGIFDNL